MTSDEVDDGSIGDVESEEAREGDHEVTCFAEGVWNPNEVGLSTAEYEQFSPQEQAFFMSALHEKSEDGNIIPSIAALPPKGVENCLQVDEESGFVGLKDGPKARAYTIDTHCPLLINGEEAIAAYDCQSTISCADPSIFKALNIEATEGPIKLKGVNSMKHGLKFAMVTMKINNKEISARLLCHEISEGRILLGHRDGQGLGIQISIPSPWTKPEKSESDLDWVKALSNGRKEERIPKEYAEKLEEFIADNLKKHENLEENVTVTDPESVYRLRLKEGAQPWYAKQYPIPLKWYKLVDEMIDIWVSKGWIIRAPDNCPYNNPILPRPKISGGKLIENVIRLCLDARWLNLFTEGGFTNIPDQDAIYAALGDYDMLSEIDIDNGYNRIPLHEDSRPFTAFTQPSTGFRWMFTVLIYGIKGAGGFFQRAILRALCHLSSNTKVYIDNVFVHTKAPEGASLDEKVKLHAEAVNKVLKALHDDNWKAKKAKCNFGYLSLRVLGSLVAGSTRSADPEKMIDLNKRGRPTTKKQLVSLMAFINYLCDYIPAYDRVMGRLTKLQGKSKISEKDWEEAGGEDVIKDVLTALREGYVLHQPDPALGPFFIDTDASQFGVGAAIYQKTAEDEIRFIGFTSKKFNDAQKSYPAGKRELLALMNALQRWRHIVHGYPVIAVVDHKSLTYMKTSTSYMILDWLNFLQRFDLSIVHRPGLKHVLPDALSHLYNMSPPNSEPNVNEEALPDFPRSECLSSESSSSTPNEEDFDDAEWVFCFDEDCDDVDALFAILAEEEDCTFASMHSIPSHPSLKEAAEIVRRFGATELGKQDPGIDAERMKIVEDVHSNGPHESAYNLQRHLFYKLGYFWPRMYNMCRLVCDACAPCIRFNVTKTGFHPAVADPVTSINDTWGWDILDIQPHSNGYMYILLVLDFATRKCWLIPLKTKDAGVIAFKFFCLACMFGFPLSLQSDKDPSFCNAILRFMKDTMDVKSKWSAPFCPWTNPVVENQAKTTKNLLRKVLDGNYHNWELKCPIIEHYLNSRIVESTKSSPDTLYFLRRSRDQQTLLLNEIEEIEAIEARIKKYEDTVLPAIALSISNHAHKRAAKLNASRAMAKKLLPGDNVMMKVMDKDNKSFESWDGPYMVVNKAKKGYTIMNQLDQIRSHNIPRNCLKKKKHADDSKGGWWEVLKILSHKKLNDNTYEYETLFDGYDDPYWIHESSFNSKNIITTYWKKHAADKKKKEAAEKNATSAIPDSTPASPKGKEKEVPPSTEKSKTKSKKVSFSPTPATRKLPRTSSSSASTAPRRYPKCN